MFKRANLVLIVFVSSCLVLALAGKSVLLVHAPSGDFFLGSSTMSEEVWTSSSPKHVQVTVTVTSAMADTYADTQPSSVTVKTDNSEVTLHKGDSKTIEDASTTSVRLYENAGHDHNYHYYYGIGGTWEVTVLGGGGDGGLVFNPEDAGDWVVWGFVAAIIIGLSVAVVFLLIRRKNPQSAIPPPPPYP